MKKIKPILSIVLVCAMFICAVPFSAGATYSGQNDYYTFDPENYVPVKLNSNTATYSEKMKELRWYLCDCDDYFNLGAIDMPNDDQARPYYYGNSLKMMSNTLKEVYEKYDKRYEVTYSDKEIEELYNTVKNTASQMVLDRQELNLFITRICDLETNDNGYYSDELWNDFTTKLNNAKNVYDDETITDIRVSNAYWDLFHSFNALCLSNPLPGDVNNDGKVNIMDATSLQRGLAKVFTVNASQQFVGYIKGESIASVTEIQKYLASISSNENWCPELRRLQSVPNTKSFRANKLVYADIYARLFPGYWD